MATSLETVQSDQAETWMQRDQLETWLDRRLDDLLPRKLKEIEAAKTPSMAIIVTKGTLDWAYPPFILASTAAALGWEVSMFFTFYGLPLLKKEIDIGLSPLGNPAMPMKMPFGPRWFQGVEWPIPNLVMAGVPGFERLATSLMKKTFKNKGVATVTELRQLCLEADVKMVACSMTVDVFGYSEDDLIPEVAEYAGATSFLVVAQTCDATLFI